MRLLTILDKIFHGNDEKIIELIASSVYIKEFQFKPETLIFNTGLTFYSHKNTSFTLFFDCFSETLIRQVKDNPSGNKVPSLLGLVMIPDDKGYLSKCLNSLIVGMSSTDFKKCVATEISYKDIRDEHSFKTFDIYENDELEDIIKTYPTSKELSTKVFIAGKTIKAWNSDYCPNTNQIYNSNQAFFDATDGQLEDIDSETGWTMLGRD